MKHLVKEMLLKGSFSGLKKEQRDSGTHIEIRLEIGQLLERWLDVPDKFVAEYINAIHSCRKIKIFITIFTRQRKNSDVE